jgi:hypothetical protein
MAYNIQPPVRRERKSMFELPKNENEHFEKDSFKEESFADDGEFKDESGTDTDSGLNDNLG